MRCGWRMSSVRKVPWENSPPKFATNMTSTRMPRNDTPVENDSAMPPAVDRESIVGAPRPGGPPGAAGSALSTTAIVEMSANSSAPSEAAT